MLSIAALLVLGCSDPVYYPQTTAYYSDDRFERTDTGDGADGASDGTDGTADGADGTSADPLAGVPCSSAAGAATSFTFDNRRTDSAAVWIYDESCTLQFQGNANQTVATLDSQVGLTWVFSDDAASVVHAWIQLEASNPDIVLIQ